MISVIKNPWRMFSVGSFVGNTVTGRSAVVTGGTGTVRNATTPPSIYRKLEQKVELKRKGPKWGKGLLKRLENDGGSAILKTHYTFFHIEYTRFIEPCGDVKGLTLDDALLQLDWNQRKISEKFHEALTEGIVHCKEHGFDLSKTYIADAYVKESKTGISEQFTKKYLRGRGRYGATPHPKFARLELIFQQREQGFAARENDPLEWVRVRMRQRKKNSTKTALELYEEKRQKRIIKPIYVAKSE
jgi:hypothetical protein